MDQHNPTGFVVSRRGEPSPLSDVQPAPDGLLLSQENVPDIENCLGAVAIPAGVVSTEAVKHETSEVMYVAAGCGEVRTEEGAIPISTGDAVFIPDNTWHWLANTGEDDLISVFSFPRPDRPNSHSGPTPT